MKEPNKITRLYLNWSSQRKLIKSHDGSFLPASPDHGEHGIRACLPVNNQCYRLRCAGKNLKCSDLTVHINGIVGVHQVEIVKAVNVQPIYNSVSSHEALSLCDPDAYQRDAQQHEWWTQQPEAFA